MASKDSFVTTYCNKPHRLEDGKPIDHECYILPTAALHAERDGQIARAMIVLAHWKKRRVHKGVRSKTAA